MYKNFKWLTKEKTHTVHYEDGNIEINTANDAFYEHCDEIDIKIVINLNKD